MLRNSHTSHRVFASAVRTNWTCNSSTDKHVNTKLRLESSLYVHYVGNRGVDGSTDIHSVGV
jgi:hypothetical protein